MIQVHVNPVDISEIKKTLKGLDQSVQKVTRMAVNRTLTGVRTDATNEVSNVITAPKKRIRDSINVEKLGAWNDAQGRMPAAYVRCKGRPLPLVHFKARQVKKGVTVQVKKSGSRELIEHAFIAYMPTKDPNKKHKGVYWRKNWGGQRGSKFPKRKFGAKFTAYGALPKKYRLPVRELYSLGVPHVLAHPPVMSKVLSLAGGRLEKELKQAMNYYLSKQR